MKNQFGMFRVARMLFLFALSGIGADVWATDYYYVGASNVWNTAACYAQTAGGAGLPGSEDRIVLSKNQTVYIDQDTIGFFSSVKEVYVSDAGITVYISLSRDADLGCLFGTLSSKKRVTSAIVKTGPGTLRLAKTTPSEYISSNKQDYYGYHVCFDVREGGLDLGPMTTGGRRHRFGELKIASNAVVSVSHAGITCPEGLSGFGILTNTVNAGELRIVSSTDSKMTTPCVFAGEIGGFSRFSPTANLWLTGTNNTTASFLPYNATTAAGRGQGETGFMTWAGDANTPSSLGLGNWGYDSGSAILMYLGETGETIERTITANNTTLGPIILDGGAHGGLVFTGAFDPYSGTGFQQRLELTGSHANACVLSNCLGKIGSDGETASFFIRKTGSGTWRFCEREGNRLSGVVRVDAGTLEFDSVRQLGRQSALGDATDLFEDKSASPTNLTPLACAVYAGGAGDEAVLSYTGTNSPTVYGRPFGVTGSARFKAPNCKALVWDGVRGEADGESRLTFESAAGQRLRIANVSDANGTGGSGTLSVIKDGVGELVLSGEQSFGGDLVVNAGTVTVQNVTGRQYSYYRLSLKENAAASTLDEYSDYSVIHRAKYSPDPFTRQIALNEFGLYAADGSRVNVYTQAGVNAPSVAELEDRQISVENNDQIVDQGVEYAAGQLLNSYRVSGYTFRCRWTDINENPTVDDPASWLRVVLKMASDAAPSTSFDLNYVYWEGDTSENALKTKPFSSTLTAFALEGSADGCTWESLYETNNISFHPTAYYAWLSDGSIAPQSAETAEHRKIPLPQSTVQTSYDVLGHMRALKVAKDAVFAYDGMTACSVSNLWVDASSGLGTISGVMLTEDGVLRVDNLPPKEDAFFPADLSGVTHLERAANWQIQINGSPTRKYTAQVTEYGLSLSYAAGTVLIFR